VNEKSTLIGIGAGLALIYGAIFFGKGWATFFDITSIIIVAGGTFSALMVNYSMTDLAKMPDVMKEFLQFENPDFMKHIDRFSKFSRTARREGLLSLDRELQDVDDNFTQTGLEMAIDGLEIGEIEEMLRLRMVQEIKQRKLGSSFFTSAGTYAPAFGMIGTLIGLIQMLQNLTDPAQIGAGMSTALVTTFYGALLGNLIFLPMASKMNAQAQTIQRIRQITLTGILAIVRGESPTLIERKLMLYLPEMESDEESAEANTQPLSRAA
jgi:chemotaxis protein MotA